MITRIEAHKYRCFRKLAIDLDRYHVLAGANGAGKTTLLDIPVLIGDMVRGQGIVGAFLGRQEGGRSPRASALTDSLHKGQGDAVAFAIEAKLPASVLDVLYSTNMAHFGYSVPTHLRYELRLEVAPRSLRVADEYLFLFPGEDAPPEAGVFPQGRSVTRTTLAEGHWQSVIHREGGSLTKFTPETTTQATEVPPLRLTSTHLALSAVPPDETLFPAAIWFADLLRSGVVYFDPDWEALRRPAPPGDPARILPTGQNLPWLAMRLQNAAPDEFASWIDHVRTALPQVKAIRVIEREEDHYAYFAVHYHGGYQVTSSGLSDGTLRILAMTILPFLPGDELPMLLVVEEPENGIHPRAIETVLESVSSLYGKQVWTSTHSPIVLAHTELRDILTTRLDEDGVVTVIPGNQHPRLRDWQGELDLGTLFAAGVLS